VAMDTTQSVAADRTKLYINGVQETVFTTESYPALNYDTAFNTTLSQSIGRRDGSTTYYDGNMAHLHAADGLAYAPTVFGEVDSTSGIWIAKTSPSVTYGTNGGFYKFASGASGTDSSGEDNTMTVTGNLTNNKDNPDNNFCTMNPLSLTASAGTYSNGNNTWVSTTGNYRPIAGTIPLTKGLWYFECKQTTKTSGQEELLGITGDANSYNYASNSELSYSAAQYAYNATTGNIRNNNALTSYGIASAQNSILGVYIDLNANKLYFAKDGTVMNSGTGYSITAAASIADGFYLPAVAAWSGTAHTLNFNFGNGYFGTTAVTSAVADAGGIGAFEYDPSAGTFDGSSKDFRAICTNNLATYG